MGYLVNWLKNRSQNTGVRINTYLVSRESYLVQIVRRLAVNTSKKFQILAKKGVEAYCNIPSHDYPIGKLRNKKLPN